LALTVTVVLGVVEVASAVEAPVVPPMTTSTAAAAAAVDTDTAAALAEPVMLSQCP
jgi:hypothetical protein